jgi:hypothetical protein
VSEIKHCQVLGPFNSGTSLMQMYLGQLYQNSTPKMFPYWKHSLPPDYYRYPWEDGRPKPLEVDLEHFSGVLFVCMVRSPFAWVQSTCRRSYDIDFKVQSLDLSQRIRSPIVFRRHQRFENIVQMWNAYYRQYELLLEREVDMCYVRLEDLAQDPENALRPFEERLQRRQGSDLAQVIQRAVSKPMKATNAFGQSWEESNRPEHLARVIPQGDLQFLSQQIEPALTNKFGYRPLWIGPSVQ